MVYLCGMISQGSLKRLRQLRERKYRERYGLFVAEGAKVIGELRAVVAPVEEYYGADADRGSGMVTSPGALAVFPIDAFTAMESHSSLVLLLDGVRDPGNLGTILRVADWYGIDHIYCSMDCADVFNPKVVQSTMGALAHVRVDYVDLVSEIERIGDSMPVYGTSLAGEDVYASALSATGAIVLGNESAGITPAVAAHIRRWLTIPRYGVGRRCVESLNVALAAGILCSEFRRRSSEEE